MTRHVRSWAIAALAVFALAGAATRSLAGIIYTVTNDLTHQSEWSLAGTITLSGDGTFNNARAVKAWDITASKTGSPSHRYSNVLSDASVLSAGTLEATASDLKLGGGSFLIFYATLPNVGDASMSQLRWVNNGDQSVYTGKWAGTDLWLSEANSANAYSPSVGGLWTVASGGTPISIPEIDPAGIGSVLALVTGALGLLERRRLKTA